MGVPSSRNGRVAFACRSTVVMEEQIPPEPQRRPDFVDAVPAEPAPSPAVTPAPAPILAAQPTGGDPFHAVAPPPPVPLASAMPPLFTPAPTPARGQVSPPLSEPAPLAPQPRVFEVEATALSASDVRRPVVDAAPLASPPPMAEAKPAETYAASAPPPQSSSAPPPSPAFTPPSPPPPVPPRAPKPPSRFKRNAWAILCHLLLVLVIPTVFLGATLTFLIWQIKGKKSSHVEDQGREALNFQINVAALTAVLAVSCLGAPLIVLVWFVAIVMAIIAARHALHGENYRYPWVFRIVSH